MSGDLDALFGEFHRINPTSSLPKSYPLSLVVDEILILAPPNVSHAAHIWKLAFHVAHLEKNEGFLGTQVVIIKSQPRKHSQCLRFARKRGAKLLIWSLVYQGHR